MKGFMRELTNARVNNVPSISFPPQDIPKAMNSLHVEYGSQQTRKADTVITVSFRNFTYNSIKKRALISMFYDQIVQIRLSVDTL